MSAWISKVPFTEVGMNEDKMVLLEELAEDSKYWENALSFIESISSRKLSSLSLSQRGWLYDIDATLGVELSRRTTKEVWKNDTGPHVP